MTRTVTLLPLLAIVSLGAYAQVPPGFTAHHSIQFAAGTEPVRKLLSADPSLRELVAGNFSIAREDLNDDGSKEMILIAQESKWCGSGGCSLVVLEMRAGKIVTILSQNVAGTVAVTNEKIGQYRGLAAVDDTGTIVRGDRPGTPLFGKQLVYQMNVSEAAQARPPAPPGRAGAGSDAQRQAAPPPVAGPPVCRDRLLCTESLSFAATITDFQAILQNGDTKTLTLRMQLQNKLNRPLILGYVSGSGVATDERGNRYVPRGERAVQGIGLVQGNTGDPKFTLQPGESSDARFELVWNSSAQEIFGLSFQVDLAIREIETIPGNQLRLGREHALHFSGLGNRAGAAVPGTPRATSTPPPPALPGGAPAPAAAAPKVDACAGRPRCYSAGPFAAEITGLTPSSLNYNPPVDVLQARVRFRNLTNQPIILGYVDKTAVISDNYGGRYTVTRMSGGTLGSDGAKGIGVVRPQTADSQFVLGPGISSEATFTVSHGRDGNGPVGTAFSFDLTIAQLEVLPSQQTRTVREYSVGFTGLSASAQRATNPTPPTVDDGVAPQVGVCPGTPRCYREAPFVAEISGVTSSFLNYNPPVHVLQAKVQFRNLTNQPIILGYVHDSALITDNYGGRYTITHTSGGTLGTDGVKGIGEVSENKADPQFVLGPGASGNATMTVSRSRKAGNSDPMGSTFDFDLTIALLEVLPSQQIRTIREYAVGIPNLTASGPSILNRLLQGATQK